MKKAIISPKYSLYFDLNNLFVVALLFSPLLIFCHLLYLLIIGLFATIFLLISRKYYFYENYLIISFFLLKRKWLIEYHRIKSVTYKLGSYASLPIIIIKLKRDFNQKTVLKTLFLVINIFNRKNAIVLLRNFKKNGFDVIINTKIEELKKSLVKDISD